MYVITHILSGLAFQSLSNLQALTIVSNLHLTSQHRSSLVQLAHQSQLPPNETFSDLFIRVNLFNLHM